MSPAPYRLFVLLAWHAVLVAAVDPVGVLGVTEHATPGAAEAVVVWMPLTYQAAGPWRDRLATPPTAAHVEAWLDEHGATQLAEVVPPDPGMPVAGAVEAVLDLLLAEVIPAIAGTR